MPYTYHENKEMTLFIRIAESSIEYVQLRGVKDKTDKLFSYSVHVPGSLSPITGLPFDKVLFQHFKENLQHIYKESTEQRFKHALNHLHKTIAEIK